jgi:hypothetical protein
MPVLAVITHKPACVIGEPDSVQAAVAQVHAIDDGIAKRSAALDDPSTHEGAYIDIH